MNQNFHRSPPLTLLLPLLVLSIVIVATNNAGVASRVASRLLPPQTTTLGSDGNLNADKGVLGHDVAEIKEGGSWNAMELEDLCEDANEECLKRRMTYEAHLDYIYTQHNKP